MYHDQRSTLSDSARCAVIVDGRTARRNRNRDRVLDALISIAADGNDDPSVHDVADRAGVSYRSVYRYFDDRTDLVLSAIGRIMGAPWSVFDIEQYGQGTLDERVERFIGSRLRAYRQLAPLTRLIIRRSGADETVAADYERVRALLRAQLDGQFAPEFEALPPDEREIARSSLNVLFQFEAFEFLAEHDGLDEEAIAQVLARQLLAHLAPTLVGA